MTYYYLRSKYLIDDILLFLWSIEDNGDINLFSQRFAVDLEIFNYYFFVIFIFDVTLAGQVAREAFFLAWNNLATAALPFFPQMLASFALFIMSVGLAFAPIFLIDRLRDKLKLRITSS